MYVHDDGCSGSTKRQCKSHGVTKCDADPEHLFRVRCSRCDYVRDFDPSGAGAAKYLYYRRRTRAARGLLSVGAPLDGPSAGYLCQAAAECGIVSNTSQPHVTFVEGLVPDVDHTAAIGRLRSSLFSDPKLTVVSVHRVPRRDNATDLILADVILSPGADAAATELSDGRVCHLPQFPFHVALGACPKARGGSKWAAARAEQRLKGVALSFDATRVRVLPPPEGSKKLLQQKHHQHQGQHPQQPRQPRSPHHSHGHGHRAHAHSHGHRQHGGHHAHPHTPPRMHYHHPHQHQHQHEYQHGHYPQQLYYPGSSPQQPPHWGGAVTPAQAQQAHAQQQRQYALSPASSFGPAYPSSDQGSVGLLDDGSDDAASTSGSSSASSSEQEQQVAQFPGLAVDLDFLDEQPAAESKTAVAVVPAAPVGGSGTVSPALTSIWAQS